VPGLSASGVEQELLTSIVAATRDRLGAAACSVALLDGNQLEFRAADGAGAAQVIGMRLPVGRGLAGYVVASGQAIAVAEVRRDQRFDIETAESTGYVPSSILAVPVEDDEGPMGVLEVLDRQSGPRDMDVAAAAARQILLVVRLAGSAAEVNAVLADQSLAVLVNLLRQFRDASERDRSLAAALLSAVLDRRS
jgi:signal transduction protein with GAF and PtsI domain